MAIKRHSFIRFSCFLSGVLLIASCGGGGGEPAPTDNGGNNPGQPLGRDNPPATNAPPSINGTPPTSVVSGVEYSFLPSAQDGEANTLTFTISNQPIWATFDSITGLLSGTPGAQHLGTTPSIVISVTDGTSTTSLPAFDLQVTNSAVENSPPVITSTAITSATEGQAYSYQVVASDPDSGSTLNYSLAAAPVGMSVSGSGVITWNPASDGVGRHTISVKVTDNGSPAKDAEQHFTLNVAAFVPPVVPNAPRIQSVAPKHASQATVFTYQVLAVDGNADPITYSLQASPDGMTINPVTGLISWSVPADRTGTQTVVVAVADPSGLKTTQTFALSIVIPRTGWSASTSSEETINEDGTAKNALDGNTSTLWHTKWSSDPTPPPHDVQIDLGATYDVTGFLYLPRQDGRTGIIKQYQFFVSESKNNWGVPVAIGIFADNNSKEKLGRVDAPLTFKTGRYVKLVALSEQTGLPYIGAAELNLQGKKTGNRAPQVVIDRPTAAISNIRPGQTVNFSATTSDPEGGVVTYAWSFGDPAIAGSRKEDPGVIVFPTAGTYSVKATATDDKGLSTVVKRIVRVLDVNESLVPRQSWTALSDSEEKVAEDGSARNAFDDNPQTIWHTQWFDAAPAHPHNLSINLGAVYSVTGIRHLPRQDGPSGRIAGYEVYAGNDGATWTLIHSGTFANNAAETKVIFASTDARHIRLVSTSEVAGKPFASVAEFNVMGTPK